MQPTQSEVREVWLYGDDDAEFWRTDPFDCIAMLCDALDAKDREIAELRALNQWLKDEMNRQERGLDSARNALSDMHDRESGCRFDNPDAPSEDIGCMACFAFHEIEEAIKDG